MSTLRVGMAAFAIAATSSFAMAQTTTPPADTPPAATAPAPDATMAPKPDAMAPKPDAMAPKPDAMAPAPKPDTAMNETGTESQKPPLAGANSFTEGQARDRITKAGFEDVQTLKKDDQGVWRGQAKKAGQQVNVGLDYRGNVVQQ